MTKGSKFVLALASATALVFWAGSARAETVEYSGRIYSERAVNLLPLGNGDGVMTIAVAGVVAMSGEPPSLFSLNCAGLGLVDPEGKATSDVYCTMGENSENSFDLKATIKEGDGQLKVIGGTGRFTGATGSGTFERVENNSDSSKGIIKVRITTR